MKLRNYTSEKIFDPRNTREKKILDPRNTYLKKFGTHERSMQKNFGPTKYPRRHDGTRPMKFSTLCKSIYIFWKFIQYTMHWDKKNPSEKMTVTKNAPFFFPELQLITVLLSIHNSYVRWSARFISLKLCVGFSIFDSVLFLLKLVFLFS